MSCQSKPTSNGVYRIKVLNQNLYIQSVPAYNAGLTLAPLSPSDNKQKWNLTQVNGQSNWTIVSVEDQSGVTYQKDRSRYWGYGYPYPQSGPSENWSILEETCEGQTFSKIRLSGFSDCFDSCSGSDAVHFYYSQSTVSKGPRQCFVFELVPTRQLSPLDVIFIQDATASQQPYINQARDEISKICNTLKATGNFANPYDLRFGVTAFRDHPPQEQSFVTLKFPFTSDVNTVANNLACFAATGGGGGPEAQSDALSDVLRAPWNNNATKVAVLITDSPPHGIGEINDDCPNGGPLQIEPLRIAKRMASIGIKLYVVACEPTLSRSYTKARSFYEGLVAKTGGCVVNLGDPNTLSSLIIASVPCL